MSFRIDMSASELFDLIRPAVSVLSALLATAILASARKRFPLYQALLLAIATFFFPLIVLPLYLGVLLFWNRKKIQVEGRLVIPLFFLSVILSSISVLKYLEDGSVDAYLSRAELAKVNNNPTAAIREYRQALKLEENPHTRKLLAITLEEAGLVSEAITEFRLAEQGGEPDDSISYRLALLFERSDKKGEAIPEFKKFLASKSCSQIDTRCEEARKRVEDSKIKTTFR